MRLGNLLKLVLRLELCLLQAKGLCSGLDIIFPSTLLRLEFGNKYEARPSVPCVVLFFFFLYTFNSFNHANLKFQIKLSLCVPVHYAKM